MSSASSAAVAGSVGSAPAAAVVPVVSAADLRAAVLDAAADADAVVMAAAVADFRPVRVAGAKRDDLQAAMALLRKEVAELPLEFNNFRD